MQKASLFQERIKKQEEDDNKKQTEEVTEQLQEIYAELRDTGRHDQHDPDDDADSLPSQTNHEPPDQIAAAQFSPTGDSPKIGADARPTGRSTAYSQIISRREKEEEAARMEEEKAPYDPLSVLEGLTADELPGVVEEPEEEEARGVFMLWEGMLLIGNTATPIATCIYALEGEKKLKQLAKLESAASLRIKGRCKVEDILDYYRKNQSSRV